MSALVIEQALKSLWTGKCTVTQSVPTESSDFITRESGKVIYKDLPCRLSYHTSYPGDMGDGVTRLAQEITVFLDKTVSVPAGCRLVITQNGVTNKFKASGHPRVFSSHQEIRLELEKDKA